MPGHAALRKDVCLSLECEIFLRKETENGGDDRGDHLGWGGINMQCFNKQFETQIVDEYTQSYYYQIPYELYTSALH